MIYKTPSTLPGHIRIVFELPSSVWAHHISVSGEFNNWQRHSEPLHQDRDGQWRAVVDLPINCQYKFHYLVDGNELIDRHADGLSQDNYREQKSIVSTVLPYHDSTVRHRRPADLALATAADAQTHGFAEPANTPSNQHVIPT